MSYNSGYYGYSTPRYTSTTVHHVYHVQVPYQCGNCQRSAIGLDWIPQCTACGVQLCKDCNNHEFCPEHWNALSVDDQDEIIKMEKHPIQRLNPWGICLVVLAVLAVIPFSLLPVLVDEFRIEVHLPIMMAGIFGDMFLIIILSVVSVKRRQSKMVKRQQWIDELLSRYNFKPKIPQTSNANRNQFNQQNRIQNATPFPQNITNETYRPSSVSVVNSNEINQISKRCLMCGFENKDKNAAYCNRCGTRL